ncbi:YrbL family protein [Prosthecochloris sp. HL-130-GSB]|jgi:hypothetical protein|uniref:PhoP regulatory network protein YrbL n=1 Tax=Prosthecochloris aestuarii TaxID=1102 RepID=A0A831STM4_PROAE|nr:YrbL family protein [Prosthecochloris sp. HL-130-GSB]ARM30271.1 hypothetical protein B9H02_01675 [Prosthecochloris sp. HL-130-GSB]MBO8091880.1 hypothetical protein [Prosthecochloris sp.]HED31517.1 hypothetical protein [Prosthecochloris aestuarii]
MKRDTECSSYVELVNARCIGEGAWRVCYEHPVYPGRCIKVDKNASHRVSAREAGFYRRFVRRKVSFDYMAMYHGTVSTDLGTGYVFSMVRDYDGGVSETLKYYLGKSMPERVLADIIEGVLRLRRFMLAEGVTVTMMEAHNMVYQKTGRERGKVVLVDGIGNNQFLPVANYVKIAARRVVRRKWQTFERRLLRDYGNNPQVQRLVGSLRSRE